MSKTHSLHLCFQSTWSQYFLHLRLSFKRTPESFWPPVPVWSDVFTHGSRFCLHCACALGRTWMGLVIKSPAASFGPVGGKDAQHNVPAKTDTEKNSLTHLFDLKDKPEKANVIFSFHGQSWASEIKASIYLQQLSQFAWSHRLVRLRIGNANIWPTITVILNIIDYYVYK